MECGAQTQVKPQKTCLARGFRIGDNDEPAPCVSQGVFELVTFAHGDCDVPAEPDRVEAHQVGRSVGRDEGDGRRLSRTRLELVRYRLCQVVAPVKVLMQRRLRTEVKRAQTSSGPRRVAHPPLAHRLPSSADTRMTSGRGAGGQSRPPSPVSRGRPSSTRAAFGRTSPYS